jgi:ribulose-bisphosphate carboxylase large chain
MRTDEMDGFFARREALDAEAYLELDFRFECAGDPRRAAALLCSEQSTTQWRRVGVEEDWRPRHAAKVVELHAEPRPGGFSYDLPGAPRGEVHACRATIMHPHGNFGPRFPNLMTSVMGEGTFFAPGIPIVRLEDIRFPASFLAGFEGPRFGLEGIRAQLDAHGRPIFIGVIKPNIGLPPAPFAEIGEQGLLGGLDVVKDDEMLTDTPWSPTAERARLLGAASRRAAAATGAPKQYMANVTDEVSRLAALHDAAVAGGAGCLLVNVLPVGLSGVRLLRAHARVPLYGHFPFIAAFSRVPGYGVSSRVFTKLQRLAGVDAVIMPGFGPRMMMPEGEVLECVRACTEPMGPIRPSLPVPGGSDWAGTLEGVHRRIGSVDFGFIPGRGVFGHPMGPAAGARSLRQAWEGIVAGLPFAEVAARHEEVRAAVAHFGG